MSPFRDTFNELCFSAFFKFKKKIDNFWKPDYQETTRHRSDNSCLTLVGKGHHKAITTIECLGKHGRRHNTTPASNCRAPRYIMQLLHIRIWLWTTQLSFSKSNTRKHTKLTSTSIKTFADAHVTEEFKNI